MIKYLSNIEKSITRNIWEEIFKEDSQDFLNYYYEYKNKDNKILCKFIDNEIASMLHLNPYNMFINNKIYKSYYIVAVATLSKYRKKGYMADLLNKSLNDMYKENIPFTFLRPAKKEIYLPFDFEYIYDHNFLNLENTKLKEVKISENDYKNIADFTNKFLQTKYSTFCFRDYDYIKTLHNEVISENGNIVMLFNNDSFVGYYVYWGIEEKNIRAIFLDDKFTNVKENKPLVMARIVNLYEFFKNFSLKSNNLDNIHLYLKITDNIIKENNGIFKLSVFKDKSYIESCETTCENILDVNIKDLLSIFFGYKNINLFTKNNYILSCLSKINTLDKVFIDEEV